MKEIINFEENDISINQFLLPQTVFSCGNGNRKVKLYYISDIHLIHHLNLQGADCNIEENSTWQKIKLLIDDIVDGLFSDELIQDIMEYYSYHSWRDSKFYILFGGDISSKTKITEYFYQRFQFKFGYYMYKAWEQSYWFNSSNAEESEQKYKALMDGLQEGAIDHSQDEKQNVISGEKFSMPKMLPIIAILGNHELIDFSSVEEAVKHYKTFFENNRIFFFHNSGCRFRNFIAIGGIGFAKYDNQHNATNIVTTTPPMSREEEIKQSEIFYEFYNYVLEVSKKENKHLVVLCHYPVQGWLNEQTDGICTYFTGHSHQNYVKHSETVDIYADNQIGYKDKNIKFKSCILGYIFNPFINYKDGYYEITTQQYLQFYSYCGEILEGTKLIEIQINKYNAKFYMIKQSGVYGFFVINPKTGTKICVGGQLRNISQIKDINYFNDCFINVLSKYVQLLSPYRKVQEQISADVKRLGFEGTIHGCIVDVNFFNHIMINPFDGSLTFYYSPFWGALKKYNDLSAMLSDIVKDEIAFKNDKLPILQQMQKDNCLITKSTNDIQQQIGQMVKIDIKNSLYNVSAKINQLQRIFSSNILRDWNDDWAQLCLDDGSMFIKKLPPQTNIADEEWDKLLEKDFNKFISITEHDMEEGIIIWETKGVIKQPMLYAILRKFFKCYHNIIFNYKEINFGFARYTDKVYEYVSVECSPAEVSKIDKCMLLERTQYNNSISYHMEFNKKSLYISVGFITSKKILKLTGSYIYKDNCFNPVKE